MSALCGIVQKRGSEHPELLPQQDEVVLHLRLGDTVHNSSSTWAGEAGGKHHYDFGKKHYEDVIGKLQKLPEASRNLTVVGWTHHGGGLESDLYRALVADFFEQRGYRVTRRFEHLPDEDFIYLSHAAYFVVGGGGYSRRAAECVKRLGGTNVVSWEGHEDKAFSAGLKHRRLSERRADGRLG
mmetsp:Transcript_107749/g.313630  ORF Transcript_107749/g.313630 Transcript_107749/m.313630 type:complete len:183 (+) Transcript_107749:240-788(+)